MFHSYNVMLLCSNSSTILTYPYLYIYISPYYTNFDKTISIITKSKYICK